MLRLLVLGFVIFVTGACETTYPTGTTYQRPSHNMTDSHRSIGRLTIELAHGNPLGHYWIGANADANQKCRDWGYSRAEVKGTQTYQYLRKSVRSYECVENSEDAPEPIVLVNDTDESVNSSSVGAWQRTIRELDADVVWHCYTNGRSQQQIELRAAGNSNSKRGVIERAGFPAFSTTFKLDGLDYEWWWGGASNFALVIGTSNYGRYYDFSIVDEEGFAKPSDVLECKRAG